MVRDLCKEKYRGIFEIPVLAQKESTCTSDKEGSYKTAYASFLSILYLKNMDQTKYGSFIKKMAEDFATGQENIYLTHIGMYNIICPSINMTKVITTSEKSIEMIATKVACLQRMTILLPLGMYPV